MKNEVPFFAIFNDWVAALVSFAHYADQCWFGSCAHHWPVN